MFFINSLWSHRPKSMAEWRSCLKNTPRFILSWQFNYHQTNILCRGGDSGSVGSPLTPEISCVRGGEVLELDDCRSPAAKINLQLFHNIRKQGHWAGTTRMARSISFNTVNTLSWPVSLPHSDCWLYLVEPKYRCAKRQFQFQNLYGYHIKFIPCCFRLGVTSRRNMYFNSFQKIEWP